MRGTSNKAGAKKRSSSDAKTQKDAVDPVIDNSTDEPEELDSHLVDDDNNNNETVNDATETSDLDYNDNDNDNDGSGAPNTTVTVFGMSTEGYEIARKTAIGGATVYVVDESNLTAILVNTEIARTYPDIYTLQEDEPIMSFEPLRDAVSKSEYLFFAPRIRTQNHNTKASIQALFQDAVEFVKCGASVIFCVPVGITENGDFASILQYDTGFAIGSEVSYYYYPLEAGRVSPQVIGSATPDRPDQYLAMMLPSPTSSDSDDGVRFATLEAAEHLHVLNMVSRFAQACSHVEVGLSMPDEIHLEVTPDERVQEMYVDDMIGGMFDMLQIKRSLERSKPLQKLVSMYVNTIESYIRRLVDRIKRAARDCQMRTTRIKMVMLWSFDPHLLRGDRNAVCDILTNYIHDWVYDIDILEDLPRGVFVGEKHVAVLVCSQHNLNAALTAKKMRSDLLVIKANPLCEIVDDVSDDGNDETDTGENDDYSDEN